VGPNHVMTTLNAQVRMQTRTGAVLLTLALDAFWSPLQQPDAFEPGLTYDPYNGRWLFVSAANARLATSSILLAISQTSDPTGNWIGYRIDADAQDLVWADWPTLGFNGKWVAIGVNMYNVANDAFNRSQLYLI